MVRCSVHHVQKRQKIQGQVIDDSIIGAARQKLKCFALCGRSTSHLAESNCGGVQTLSRDRSHILNSMFVHWTSDHY